MLAVIDSGKYISYHFRQTQDFAADYMASHTVDTAGTVSRSLCNKIIYKYTKQPWWPAWHLHMQTNSWKNLSKMPWMTRYTNHSCCTNFCTVQFCLLLLQLHTCRTVHESMKCRSLSLVILANKKKGNLRFLHFLSDSFPLNQRELDRLHLNYWHFISPFSSFVIVHHLLWLSQTLTFM